MPATTHSHVRDGYNECLARRGGGAAASTRQRRMERWRWLVSQRPPLSGPHTHTAVLTHRTCKHTDTHAHTHTSMRAHTHNAHTGTSHKHSLHRHMSTRVSALRALARIRPYRTNTHTYTCTHTHVNIHEYKHNCRQTYMHANKHSRMQTQTHAKIHASKIHTHASIYTWKHRRTSCCRATASAAAARTCPPRRDRLERARQLRTGPHGAPPRLPSP